MRRHFVTFLFRPAITFLVAGALLASPYASPEVVHAASSDSQDSVQVYFRDVYVIVGSTLRNPDDTTDASAPLFNIAGVSLDRTWGQFKAASATSTANLTGKNTDIRIRLTGLIPGGVYSVFYGTLFPDSENPLCPGVERTLPVISTNKKQVPDSSSLVAGANGSADFRGTVPGNPLSAGTFFFTIIYHFDGQTYGSLPNRGEFLTQGENCRSSFGEDAFRQLVIFQKGTG